MSNSLHLSASESITEAVQAPTSPDPASGHLFSSSSEGSLQSRAIPSDVTSSSDNAEESYREKFMHLQILVRQLNRQLQSEKIRRDGVDTLSRCLTEQRQDNDRLRDEQSQLQLVIRALQSRLASHGLSSSTTVDHGNILASGIVDNTTLDSLVKENLHLKSELKYLTVDPLRMEATVQQNTALRDQVMTLQQQVIALRSDKQTLEQTMRASPNDKLQEISKLRSQLDELRQKGMSKDVLCQTLSEQSQTLQHRLRETGALCQQLLHRLEVLEVPPGDRRSSTSLCPTLENLHLSTTNPSQWETEKKTLQEQLSGLGQKLDEVVVVNQRWQEYHDKRESEFQALQDRLQLSEHQLRGTSSRLSENQQEHIDKLILQYKRQLESMEDDKEKISDENRHLRQQLNELTLTNEQLERQIQGLLEQHRSQAFRGGRDGVDTAKVQALELQIKVCTEDFESERRDRERAQTRIIDLDRELQMYKSQLDSLQRGAVSRINAQRYGHHTRYTPRTQHDAVNLDDVPMPEVSSPANLIGRGIYQSDDIEVEGEDTVDTPTIHTDGPPLSLQADTDSTTQPESVLQCPQCGKKYTGDHHMDLIEHMDGCLQ